MTDLITKKGLLQNLEAGLEYEYNAVEYCSELLRLLEDPEDKRIIEGILKDEKKHVEITKGLLELVAESEKVEEE